MTTDHLAHLHALELHLSNERVRLSNAKSAKERELRAVWVLQLEKEIAHELTFMGLSAAIEAASTDDALLAALAD